MVSLDTMRFFFAGVGAFAQQRDQVAGALDDFSFSRDNSAHDGS
jgi:hypothetical protein